MKKFIAITLMAIMLVAVASTASAVSVNNPTTFSIYVNSKDSSAAYTDEENETRKNGVSNVTLHGNMYINATN